MEHLHYGGLFLLPLADILSWPYYRRNWPQGRWFRWIQHMATWDIGINYRKASFTIMVVLAKAVPRNWAGRKPRPPSPVTAL